MVSIGDNVVIASDVTFCTHDVIHNKIDVIHSHNRITSVYAHFVSNRLRIPSIWTLYQNNIPHILSIENLLFRESCAYGVVVYTKLIKNNLNGIANYINFGSYDEDVVMMMFDKAVILSPSK